MSEEKKSEQAIDNLRCNAGPTIVESTYVDNKAGQVIAVTDSPQTERSTEQFSEQSKDFVETEIQAVEASFAKGLTNKMLNAALPGSGELGSNAGASGTGDEELAKVVADPYAEENQWYSACVAAGHRCLAGLPSPVRVAVVRTAAVFGVIFSFLSIMACYVSSIYFSAHIGTMGFGLTMDGYINELVGLDYVGFLSAGAAILLFWSSFFGFFKKTFRYVTVFLFIAIMVKALTFHLLLSIPIAALWAAAYIPVLYLGEWLGGACREALPMHIGSKQLARVLLPSVAAPALTFLISMLIYCASGAANEPSHYANGTLRTLLINTFAVSFCTLIPGFVLARATKSKSPAGSAALAVMLQTPLLIGLLLTVFACLLLGMIYQTGIPSQAANSWMIGFGAGNWANFGVAKAFSIVGGIVLAAMTAGAGGAFGAWCNNKFGVKADEKPLPSELR